MKQKIGTLLEQDVVRRAKRRAADENRPLSDVIQDALERYLSEGIAEPARRDAAYQLFCERPIRLAPEQLKAVLEHDSWDLGCRPAQRPRRSINPEGRFEKLARESKGDDE